MRKCLFSILRWSDRHSKTLVVRRRELQQGHQLSPLLSWKASWSGRAFDGVLIQINQDEVIIRELEVVISSFHTNDIWARGFESLNQSGRQDRNEDVLPLERI